MPKVLGNRYKLLELIGEGSFGSVYLAEDLLMQEYVSSFRVAIKILHPKYLQQKSVISALFLELKTIREIRHRNVINIYDVQLLDGYFCLVMEYLEGETLAKYLQKFGKIDVKSPYVSKIALELKNSLEVVHASKVVHGDLKPENIFLTTDGVLKLIDFSFSVTENLPESIRIRSCVDAYTPKYASFNAMSGEKPTYQDDVFACAVILYELVMGKHPFENKSFVDFQKENKKIDYTNLPNALGNVFEKIFQTKTKGTITVSCICDPFILFSKSKFKLPLFA